MKRILITGSTDGIGQETARQLALQGHEILIHGRNAHRVERTTSQLKEATGNENIVGYVSDLASLREVTKMALTIRDNYESLDVLLNNAGILQPVWEKTVDGFEQTFQVNYLAPFLLTHLLLPLLQKSEQGRIINVSSMIHSNRIDFDDLELRQHFDGSAAYSATKLYNILFTFKLARMLSGSPVTSNCLHPGVIGTKLLRQNWGMSGASVSEGAKISVYLATEETLSKTSGRYFVNSHPANPAAVAQDKEVQDRLWQITLGLVSNYLNV
jgi:NAD(P)-dependent dehydrogenase (short-subunit alcohol dehydrogenase family)